MAGAIISITTLVGSCIGTVAGGLIGLFVIPF